MCWNQYWINNKVKYKQNFSDKDYYTEDFQDGPFADRTCHYISSYDTNNTDCTNATLQCVDQCFANISDVCFVAVPLTHTCTMELMYDQNQEFIT